MNNLQVYVDDDMSRDHGYKLWIPLLTSCTFSFVNSKTYSPQLKESLEDEGTKTPISLTHSFRDFRYLSFSSVIWTKTDFKVLFIKSSIEFRSEDPSLKVFTSDL